MKTLNKNLKVTSSEFETLTEMFNNGVTLFRKVILFGAGHPQLPSLFGVSGNVEDFLEEHETTHAKFISYNSIEDIEKDSQFCRSDLTPKGCEFTDYDLITYRN